MDGASYQTSIEAVRRWHALAERRRNHLVDLYRSERWRRYYSEDAFRTLMRDVIQNAEAWGKVLEDMDGGRPKVASAKPAPARPAPPPPAAARAAAPVRPAGTVQAA